MRSAVAFWALVGADAAGVTVQTLHGLAMRPTGTSYAVALEHGEAVGFCEVIRKATRYLSATEKATTPTSAHPSPSRPGACWAAFPLGG